MLETSPRAPIEGHSQLTKFAEALQNIRPRHQEPEKAIGAPVDDALSQLGITVISTLKLIEESEPAKSAENQRSKESTVELEHVLIDTRSAEAKYDPNHPLVINFTGAWGRAPESENEAIAWALAMGEAGLHMDLVSLPGHGRSSPLKEGWNSPGDFDAVANRMFRHVEQQIAPDGELKDKNIVFNAWSMGGITALKTAALLKEQYPELNVRVVLIDTPVFPQDFKKLAKRFVTYDDHANKAKLYTEPPLSLKTQLRGLSIFIDRLRHVARGSEEQIPLISTLVRSALSMTKQNLDADGTLGKINTAGIPVLLLHGSDDFVVPREQITKLEEALKQGGTFSVVEIKQAGHDLVTRRTRLVSRIVREWLKNSME